MGANGELRAKDQAGAGGLIKRLRDQSAEIVRAGTRFAHPDFCSRIYKAEFMKLALGAHAVEHGDAAGRGKPHAVRVVTGPACRIAADDAGSGLAEVAQI